MIFERYTIPDNALSIPPDVSRVMQAQAAAAEELNRKSAIITAALEVTQREGKTLLETMADNPAKIINNPAFRAALPFSVQGVDAMSLDTFSGAVATVANFAVPGLGTGISALLSVKPPSAPKLSVETQITLAAIAEVTNILKSFVRVESDRVITELQQAIMSMDNIAQVRARMITDEKIKMLQEFNAAVDAAKNYFLADLQNTINTKIIETQLKAEEIVSGAQNRFYSIVRSAAYTAETRILDALPVDDVQELQEHLEFEKFLFEGINSNAPEHLAEELWSQYRNK